MSGSSESPTLLTGATQASTGRIDAERSSSPTPFRDDMIELAAVEVRRGAGGADHIIKMVRDVAECLAGA